MTTRKQITYGAMLSYLTIAVSAVVTLIYIPFMIRILGQSEYGLYNTVASVISSLSILGLGFGSGYVRFFSKYKAADDHRKIARLNGMFLLIFCVIGMIAFVCGMFLSWNLEIVFDKGLTQEELQMAKRLMLLLTCNLAVSFPASVFTSIITAHERFVFQKVLQLFKQIVSPLVSIPLLLMGYASVGIVVSMVLLNLLAEIISVWYCLVPLKAQFCFQQLDFLIVRELAVYTVFIAINLIVDQINLNIDKILLGRFCGTVSVAVYSVGYTLYTYYMTFSTSISNVFVPKIHQIWNDGTLTDGEKDAAFSRLFANVGRIQFMILLLLCSGLALFGKPFIRFWAGKDCGNAYYVVLLLAVSAIVPLSQNVGIEIQRAENRHQFRAVLYLCMAVLNLMLSIYLCQRYGEIGSAFGTAVSFLAANTVAMNIFYHKAIKIDVKLYWKQCARIAAAVIPAFIFGYFLCKRQVYSTMTSILVGILCYSVIYGVCIFLFALDGGTRRKMYAKIRAAVRR